MALRGKKFDEILHHYYTGVEITDSGIVLPPKVSNPNPAK
jgi:peptidoglycan hydrolase-like amidase